MKYNSKRITLTSPDWMMRAMEGLARGNLMRRNKLINSILFDYIKANIHLFSDDRKEELSHIINEQAEMRRRALQSLTIDSTTDAIEGRR